MQDDNSTSHWLNQSQFPLDPTLDLESLLSVFPTDNALKEETKEVELDLQLQHVESVGNLGPESPNSGSDSGGSQRCLNPIPRHKRPSHKRAEIKRRDKIKVGLVIFSSLVNCNLNLYFKTYGRQTRVLMQESQSFDS